jgi:hypothetical protein
MALRQRNNNTISNRKKAKTTERKLAETAPNNSQQDERDTDTKMPQRSDWKIRLLGALFVVAVVVAVVSQRDAICNDLLPYVYLQHPELVNRFLPPALHLRPPLVAPGGDGDGDGDDLRQVLIVGTISSGTRQVVSDLQRHLNLEISHEASDASHYLVRDGTVSWFHGIRFFFLEDADDDDDDDDDDSEDTLIQTFCRYPTPRVGFHPRFYNYSACDVSQQWSSCWARECERILRQEWGCARRRRSVSSNDETTTTTTTTDDGCTTFQPFHTVLHQVRNPFHTIESLIAKFCGKDDAASRGSGFGKVFQFMFADAVDNEPRRLTCWEAVSHYVLRYSRAMLKAQQDGLINATYSIEKTSVCEVAQLAGFRNADTVVYAPNLDKIQTRCASHHHRSNNNNKAMTPKAKFKVNQGQVRLVWSDLLGGRHGSQRPFDDRSLVEEIKALMIDLDYDPDEIPETR